MSKFIVVSALFFLSAAAMRITSNVFDINFVELVLLLILYFLIDIKADVQK